MTKKLLLLSTCGTSVLTNDAMPETRRWLTEIANEATLDDAGCRRLKAHVAESRDRLLSANTAGRPRLPAEMDGIHAVLARHPAHQVQHFLVHTDTATGRSAAGVVKAILENDRHPVQLLTAAGLRTDEPTSFREALADLTRQIEEWVPGYRADGWMSIFNLTGGFKSISGYLQALGMLHADRCMFLFEGAPALMEIPRLPVRLADADEVRQHLAVFRPLALGYRLGVDEVDGVPDALLFVDDGQATTNVWGDVVWQRVRKTLLGETLLAPLSSKLFLKDVIRKAFDALQADRRVLVNEALDALSAHLDNERSLPKSNTFKRLEGKPSPPSTHELYVWSDGAAWRLYGHFEGERFVADSLGSHL
jgi:putative CRISPR-associated protein (TIGR02619 family)